ncbi:hypothetical protein CPB83DRAFT_909982 [Crepidotus variabilis]|uniref:Fe2OG dioxygenase domain-containing protein n=1 Tax=Crepidotus variabilis TaxID=179855 RepID=A0A9P6E8G9_9AGAR|nr:hypothetical protein CPB83DRAFT_909982 [Crepidotus variabilis]
MSSPIPQTVPLVDFGQFLHGPVREKQKIAKELDAAFCNVGFVYLQNHTVPQVLIDECFEWSKKFFDLSDSVKQRAPHPPGGTHHRGYSAIGLEKVSQQVYDKKELEELRAVSDVKESFESGNPDDETQPNIWLDEEDIPGFRRHMETFFDHCKDLVHHILRALAISLSLPDEKALSGTHKRSLFQLRLHYPPVSASAIRDGHKSRISAHSDFGTLTLLFQDSIGGLEVEDPYNPGTFNPVAPIPGTVVVNVGDLMERWTNGRWRSTVHRVMAPPVNETAHADQMTILKARYSIPFFATTDPETVIEALPGCWDEAENPKKYERITAWDYVQMRMAALYN